MVIVCGGNTMLSADSLLRTLADKAQGQRGRAADLLVDFTAVLSSVLSCVRAQAVHRYVLRVLHEQGPLADFP